MDTQGKKVFAAGNVCAATVAHDLCIGCGVCAGICPVGNLEMRWTPEGSLAPADTGKCLDRCRHCLDACPFAGHPDDEDSLAAALFGSVPGIRYSSDAGYYLQAYAGSASAGYRERGASGGLASYVLSSLLDRGEVDRVICVRSNPDPDRLFQYDVVAGSEAVRRAAKSAYYPVELSTALQTVRAEEARYAVIALPCFAKAIRLAMKVDRRLRERISVVAGLVCGQMKGRGFTDYLVRSLGLDPREVAQVVFRGKDISKPASNHLFTAIYGGESRTTEWDGYYGKAWHSGEFSLNPCSYCDDVFAETADIVFMDAWLPEYVQDGRGTSIVLVKDPRMASVLEAGVAEGALDIQPFPIERLVASQCGALEEKRRSLPYRLWLSRRKAYIPRKRQEEARPPFPTRLRLAAREQLRVDSQAAACLLREDGGLQRYEKRVRGARRRLSIALLLERMALRK